MPDPRPLNSALEMTPEKLAFIHSQQPSDTPQAAIAAEQTSVESSVVGTLSPEAPDADAATSAAGAIIGKSSKQTNRRRRRTNSTKNRPMPEDLKLSDSPLQNVLVPLTTRLHAHTAAALRRAYLEQKLHGRKPETKQEIVELAIQHWLRTAGYLE